MIRPVPVNDEIPNILRGLLSYRVRPERDSKENFLTEAFAYVLARDPQVATALLQEFVAARFQVMELLSIRTQVAIGDDADGKRYPDLMFEVRDGKKRTVEIWIENKWGSRADARQLTIYLQRLAVRRPKRARHLVLLTPRHSDAQVAELCAVKNSAVSLSHMTWSRIHEVLTRHHTHPITRDFEVFLREQQLGLSPISLRDALAHRKAQQGGREPVDDPFRRKLRSLCDRLLAELRPSSPLMEDGYTHDAFGRVGIWTFHQKITLGFLYDPQDHKTDFLRRARPLDIIVRIEGDLGKKEVERFRARMTSLAKNLEKAGFACNAGRWQSNPHTVLLGQYQPGFPFELTPCAQYLRVLEVFRSAVRAISDDAQAMATLARIPRY